MSSSSSSSSSAADASFKKAALDLIADLLGTHVETLVELGGLVDGYGGDVHPDVARYRAKMESFIKQGYGTVHDGYDDVGIDERRHEHDEVDNLLAGLDNWFPKLEALGIKTTAAAEEEEENERYIFEAEQGEYHGADQHPEDRVHVPVQSPEDTREERIRFSEEAHATQLRVGRALWPEMEERLKEHCNNQRMLNKQYAWYRDQLQKAGVHEIYIKALSKMMGKNAGIMRRRQAKAKAQEK